MYVYIYIYTHKCVYTNKYIYIYTNNNIYKYINIYIYISIFMYVLGTPSLHCLPREYRLRYWWYSLGFRLRVSRACIDYSLENYRSLLQNINYRSLFQNIVSFIGLFCKRDLLERVWIRVCIDYSLENSDYGLSCIV